MYENLKKSQRAGSGLRRLASVGDPKVRIIVMVVLLVLLAVTMAGLTSYSSSGEGKDLGGENAPTVAVPSARFGIPAFDMKIAERIYDDGPAARRRWPQEAVHYLLLEARNTPAVHAYRRNLLPITRGSAEQIEKDSHPWRFKYVRFRGPLEYIREENFEDVYGESDPPLGQVHRGRVAVADSGDPPVRVLFLTTDPLYWSDPNEPTAHPEVRELVDGWVRGRGVLVGNYVEKDGDKEVPVLIVVATAIERDYETVPVRSLDDIPFGIIDDDPSIGVDEDGRAVLFKEYPKALYRLVKYAEQFTGPDGAAAREKAGLKPQALTTAAAWDELTGQPHKNRAKYLGGLGAVALSPLLFEPSTITPNDAGVEECLSGWIATDQQKLFQFVAPAALGEDWNVKDRVRFEGFFYKTKLYPARNGTERLAPVLVLTVLEKVPPPTPNYTAQIVLAAGFILGIGLLVFIIVREDKTKESYRRLHRKRVIAP